MFFRDHRNFVVNDWGWFHLRRPPRGYHWVRYGDDFLMVAIATGLIADLILQSSDAYGSYGNDAYGYSGTYDYGPNGYGNGYPY